MKASIEVFRLVAVILITFTHTRNSFEDGTLYLIFEQLPLYGTAILSVISGYLYYTVSRSKKNLFQKKIKSLAIPYLIANISVLVLVLIVNVLFDYNALNRLAYNYTLITEGIFSLNSPPINPPTYFIRDIFVIFSIIAVFTQKEFKAITIILPFIVFGTLILRLDVAFLFAIGVLYGIVKKKIPKFPLILLISAITIGAGIWFLEYLKLPLAFLIFMLFVDLKFSFWNTGRYSYLLHLYHSPIIIITYPVLAKFIQNPLFSVLCQIAIALVVVYVFFLITKKFEFLKVLSGGR